MLACLGLFGLSSFNAVSRTKEIGIRKINGATTFSIMRLLLKNYTKWIVIGFLFALPISFIVGRIFLNMFFFRTPIPLWAFIVGPIIAYIIALSAVSWQSYRAASQNPVNSLRYE
jgi:putative ABC transport system permease protein